MQIGFRHPLLKLLNKVNTSLEMLVVKPKQQNIHKQSLITYDSSLSFNQLLSIDQAHVRKCIQLTSLYF